MTKNRHHKTQETSQPITRTHLSGDALLELIRGEFGKIEPHCAQNNSISMQDAFMAGLAVFVLKDPSLLAFEARRKAEDPNLKTLFGIERVPSDPQLRSRLDPICPDLLRKPFKRILAQLQRGKGLEPFAFLGGHYLISGDGTGFFYSAKLKNARCLTKKGKEGKQYHQMFYGAWCGAGPSQS